MEIEMISRSIEVKYQCPHCSFKLTKVSNFYDSVDIFDRLALKKPKDELCVMCKEEMGMPAFIKCEIVERAGDYYRLKWKCRKCSALWHSIESTVKPNDVNYHIKKALSKMRCANDDCKSSSFVCISFQRVINRKRSSEE